METQQKLARLRQFMSENDIPAVVVRRQPNFSWLTGRRPRIYRPGLGNGLRQPGGHVEQGGPGGQ